MGNKSLVGKFEGKAGDMVSIIFKSGSFYGGERQSRIYGKVVYVTPEEVCVVPVCPGNKRDEARRKPLKLRDCLSYSVDA